MRSLALGVLLILTAVLAGSPAIAQSRAELARRLDALTEQVEQLQLLVERPGSAALARPSGATGQGGTDQSGIGQSDIGQSDGEASEPNARDLLSDLTVRLQRLEREIATLTGQVEELRFANRQLTERLDRFQEDVEFRFQQGRGPGLAAAGDTADPDATAEQAPGVGGSDDSLPPLEPDGALQGKTVEEKYNYAYTLLRRNDFQAAEDAFKAFLDEHGDSDLAGNAQYWLGETYYVRERYADAARAFLSGYRD